jgi:N-acetylmuramoyl-L-alanine amidase
MATHTTQPGECFATIARDNGTNRDTLYQHPDNADLKKKRPSPYVLYPGDAVAIPDLTPKTVSKPVDANYRFKVKLPMRELRLKLQDPEGKPIASEAYTLVIGSERVEGKTDGSGLLVKTFRTAETKATLTLRGMTISLGFGLLNPVKDTPDAGASGGRERLRNLGYDVGDLGADVDANGMDGGTRTAVALFQHQAGLPVTGNLDDATMQKLVAVHGS